MLSTPVLQSKYALASTTTVRHCYRQKKTQRCGGLIEGFSLGRLCSRLLALLGNTVRHIANMISNATAWRLSVRPSVFRAHCKPRQHGFGERLLRLRAREGAYVREFLCPFLSFSRNFHRHQIAITSYFLPKGVFRKRHLSGGCTSRA